MSANRNIARLLGAAQLLVLVASALGGSATLGARVWSGSVSENLVSVANSLTQMRVNLLGEMVTSVAIIVLAALFFVVFFSQYKIVALVALGLYWAEAITLAVSRMPAYSLLRLSQEFVRAGAPDSSHFQTLGSLTYETAKLGYTIHMVFFCLGAILWYSLLYRSRCVPRALSVWGLAAVCLVSINVLLLLYDPGIGDRWILLAPYIPYAFWVFLIPFFTEIDYSTGFVLFTVIIFVRLGLNLYTNRVLTQPAQYEAFPFRIP